MVVMDREEYVTKAQELLAQPAYKLIPGIHKTKSRPSSSLN